MAGQRSWVDEGPRAKLLQALYRFSLATSHVIGSTLSNPYHQQPDRAFWGRSVARPSPGEVDPVSTPRFVIYLDEKVASAGSCFAQHIGRAIAARGFQYLVTEPGPLERQFGIYPARFGNLYTARQLLQLFQRAYGLFAPRDRAWIADGRLVDPFRPQVEPQGFADLDDLESDRRQHLAAVRRMFETMDVLVFTLGLTEGWISEDDGAVFPLAPGVAGEPEDPSRYRPHNFTVQEVYDDLAQVIAKLRVLRPALKVLLTVSPVPLIATISDRHVLTATTYSKSVLRVAAEQATATIDAVDYFPSYEVITGQHNGHRHLAEDLRSVRPEGVAEVMSIFERHYLAEGTSDCTHVTTASSGGDHHEELAAISEVICDEEAITR